MSEDSREVVPQRLSFADRWRLFYKIIWAWLTDPAVLVYRREATGKERWRVRTVEFFLFVREVVREFYDIQGTSRAASLAYTTLLSLIPLLVAFTQALQRYFRNLFPNFQTQIDNVLNVVIPYQSPVRLLPSVRKLPRLVDDCPSSLRGRDRPCCHPCSAPT